jgi:hypothetical protein
MTRFYANTIWNTDLGIYRLGYSKAYLLSINVKEDNLVYYPHL